MKNPISNNATFFDNLEKLNRTCARWLIAEAIESIRERGYFSLVLAGGTTPIGLYELLSSREVSSAFDWRRVFVFWGDERCVPPDDSRSNYRLAFDTLLSRVPIPVENIFRMPGEFESAAGAEIYEKDLENFMAENDISAEHIPVFDVVLLGMGLDGHTASLFPGSEVLWEKEKMVRFVPAPDAPPAVARLTLTLPVINRSHNVWFLVHGKDKLRIARRILAGGVHTAVYPAAGVRPAGRLHWFLTD